MTFSRTEIVTMLERHRLAPRRAFGQNFVVDANTVHKIARLAEVGNGDFVLEIGAGLGSLTLALAETGANVVAVEIDNGLVEVLRANTRHLANVEVLHADAMQLDWQPLLAKTKHWHVVANLPYNVATIIVADLLDGIAEVEHMLVMVQSEVADRLVARAGTDPYGAVSVKIDYWASSKIVGQVPPSVFYPQPRVDSALVDIRRRSEPGVSGVVAKDLFALVRAGFAKRRKMLRRALVDIATPDDFATADVNPESRAEQLDLAAWGRLRKSIDSRLAGSTR
ncbi:MAG: 16S rRNA (adenine(1518)-N(6)/adenine(1519)-N(6))-dimethyltransferase RsmA [Actinobacteria bacterium]|nr:16S rRNA (adenine(1518)-N(6)/adenine(1519)-N(6))-dimethyltransferase RsmA [Actinomycetota bacterium]MDA3017494.1 16S rRNA (adenine(1518)-N(6)/adenine(1519)-N(6))-dimethyltransferase RsmA [Actinomycetota bacterium]